MNYNHLYYFYVFVREDSVVKAAKKLSISQPALSAQLRQFELSLDEKLFYRAGRKLELTDRGRTVFSYARQMFALSEELWDSLKNATSPKGVRVQIGICDEVGRQFGMDLVSTLFIAGTDEDQPTVRLSAGTHEVLMDGLKSRITDVVLSNQPSFHEGIEILGQIKMPVQLAVPVSLSQQWGKRKGLLDKNILGAIKLFDIGFVLPAGGARLRTETDQFLEEHKISPRIVFEADMMAAVIHAVSAQIGVGFIPFNYVAEFVKAGKVLVHGPKQGFWQHGLWLLARKSEYLTPVFQRLQKSFSQLKGVGAA